MKIVLLGFVLFVLFNSASAQFIFIPHKGERALKPLKDTAKKELDII